MKIQIEFDVTDNLADAQALLALTRLFEVYRKNADALILDELDLIDSQLPDALCQLFGAIVFLASDWALLSSPPTENPFLSEEWETALRVGYITLSDIGKVIERGKVENQR